MKLAGLVTLALALGLNCVAKGAQMSGIGDAAKEPCSAAQHGRSDKASVAALLNRIDGAEGTPDALKPEKIQEFKWVDLAGDGRCELVTTYYGRAVSALEIDWKDHYQVLRGEANLKQVSRDLHGDGKEGIIKSAIRDLDGDGKKEIIMDSYLDPSGISAARALVWPQVYRLQCEKYVPASKDFPAFYETEILPKLNKEIAQTPYPGDEAVAALEMQRDKILRVLGRDPNAGLEKARYWITTDNPQLIWDAADVFRDIGGHEAELRAADQAGKEAFRHWLASHPNN